MNDIFDQDHTIPVQNPTYPMANLKSSAYAAPLGFNRPTEALGGYDTQVNPMTGQEMPQTNFARGGKVDDFTSALHDGMAAYAGGGAVQHFKSGDVVHTGTMLPNYVPIGASNISNAPTYTLDDYMSDLSKAQDWFEKNVGAGTGTTADAINRAVGTNFTTADLAKFGLTGTGLFVPGGTRGTISFSNPELTAGSLDPDSPDYNPNALNAAMGIASNVPTTTENLWGKILDKIQTGAIRLPGAVAGSSAGLLGTIAGTKGMDYLANKMGVDPHWLASKLGGYTTTTPSPFAGYNYTFTPKSSTESGAASNTPDTSMFDPDSPNYDPDALSKFLYGDDTGTDTGVAASTGSAGTTELSPVTISGTLIDPGTAATYIGTGPITHTIVDPITGELTPVDITSTQDDKTKAGNTGVVTTTTGTTTTGDPNLDQVLVESSKDDKTKAGNTGVITTTTPGAGAGITTTGDNTAVTGTGTETTKTTDTSTKPGSTGIITTTTAGKPPEQPVDFGVPKEGAGAGAWGGIPLAGPFRSAFNPMYSAATSERYGSSAAQNLQDYMASLNQSLRPGPITPYVFETAPERVATPTQPTEETRKAHGGSIHGGLGSLPGTYKAGGKLLRGPGDGMSDSIPAVIHGKQTQRAALADGEFVIPADVVSHLGNGSTDAGARKLYAMMDRIRAARTGRSRQAPQVNPDRYMPKA